MKYHITPTFSFTFLLTLFYWCCHTCRHTHRPLHMHSSSITYSPDAFTFSFGNAYKLSCNFKLLLVDVYKYEPVFGKDVFKCTKKILEIDYAPSQNIVQIHAEQAGGAKGKICVFSIDVLGTVERWEMCKGSQCWPVLQDVIHIWLEDNHCMEWKHTLPLVSPKSTSSSMSQRGPGDTQPWTILEAMTSASGRGSYCGNMNVFSIGESSREGQKDLGAKPTPLFFSSPFWERKPCKVCKEPYLLNVCLVCESYVSPIHTHTHRERGTLGSRNQPARDHRGVLSLQASQPCLTQWDISLYCFHMSSEDSITYLWFTSCVSTTLYCQKTMRARKGEPMALLLCFTFSSFILS